MCHVVDDNDVSDELGAVKNVAEALERVFAKV
jgi:hypothetical protein